MHYVMSLREKASHCRRLSEMIAVQDDPWKAALQHTAEAYDAEAAELEENEAAEGGRAVAASASAPNRNA